MRSLESELCLSVQRLPASLADKRLTGREISLGPRGDDSLARVCAISSTGCELAKYIYRANVINRLGCARLHSLLTTTWLFARPIAAPN